MKVPPEFLESYFLELLSEPREELGTAFSNLFQPSKKIVFLLFSSSLGKGKKETQQKLLYDFLLSLINFPLKPVSIILIGEALTLLTQPQFIELFNRFKQQKINILGLIGEEIEFTEMKEIEKIEISRFSAELFQADKVITIC